MKERSVARGSLRRPIVIVAVAACAAVAGVAAYLASGEVRPVFASSATILVGDLHASDLTEDDIDTSDLLVSTYATLVRSPGVLEPVADGLGPGASWSELRRRVRVDLAMNEVPMMAVVVFAPSPAEAQHVAAAIVDRVLQLGRPAALTSPGSPTSADDVRSLEIGVERIGSRLTRLQEGLGEAASSTERSSLLARIEDDSDLLARLLETYVLELQADRSSAGALHVLQRPEAVPTPLRPKPVIETVSGALAGALAGCALVWLAGLVSARRRADDGSGPGRGTDPWIVELSIAP
ncbi:MAG TPA: hypothetical protein VF351_10370 [Actinomycetota bacterium]